MQTKILIVEDDAITAMDLERILQKLDYEVAGIASTGKEAIKMAEELAPNLILVDIVLKGEIDGIEATEEIQSHFDIPVIYLTAYSDKKTLERAKLTKPYGFLTKPLIIKELLIIINSMIEPNQNNNFRISGEY